jgi:hypothetical protein
MSESSARAETVARRSAFPRKHTHFLLGLGPALITGAADDDFPGRGNADSVLAASPELMTAAAHAPLRFTPRVEPSDVVFSGVPGAGLAVRRIVHSAQLLDQAGVLLRTLPIYGAHELPSFLLA